MTAPLYKRSATRIISDFQFPIADFVRTQQLSSKSIGNWQLAIGNAAGR
jgi:hypothetical protein